MESLDDIADEFGIPVYTLERMQSLVPYAERLYGVGVAVLGVVQELDNEGYADW